MMMWVLAIDSMGMQSNESGVAHQGVLAEAKAYGRDAGLYKRMRNRILETLIWGRAVKNFQPV